MTAKELSVRCGVGHRNPMVLYVYGYAFIMYADYSVESKDDKGNMFVHLAEKDSCFENTLDFSKQFKSTESAEIYIEDALQKLANNILGESRKPRPVVKKEGHRVFHISLNVEDVSNDELNNLEWKLADAHLEIWRESGSSDPFNTSEGNYPYLIWDDSDFTLSTEPTAELVDIDEFMKVIEDYQKEIG